MKKLLAAIAVILVPALASAQGAVTPPPTETPAAVTPAAPAADLKKEEAKRSLSPTATPTTTATATPEQLASEGGAHLSVNLDNSVGSGTFANAAYYASVVSTLSIAPNYSFAVKGLRLNATGSANLGFEFTRPDNVNGRRISWSDLRAGVSAPAVYINKLTGIVVTPNMGYFLPITMESHRAQSLGSLVAGVAFSRGFFDKLQVRYSVSGARAFQSRAVGGLEAQTASEQRDAQGNLIYVCRTSDIYCGVAGISSAYSIGQNLGANFIFNDSLSLSASFGIQHRYRWGASATDDANTAKTTDVNGNRVARYGSVVHSGDSTSTSISLNYGFTEIFSGYASVGTGGPAKTMDNSRFRFPFFDTLSTEDSLTSYSVGLSAFF